MTVPHRDRCRENACQARIIDIAAVRTVTCGAALTDCPLWPPAFRAALAENATSANIQTMTRH